MHRHHNILGIERLQVLLLARLISRFERCSLTETYEMASGCYEVLLDILEDTGTLPQVSGWLNAPPLVVKTSAQMIIHTLLFNRENNPYISLGLQRHVTMAEVSKRWKRLMTLYHPDKYPNQKDSEEEAKKINEAFSAIQEAKGSELHHETMADIRTYRPPKTLKRPYVKRLKYLPALIIAAAVIIAVISVLLLIKTIRKPHAFPLPRSEHRITSLTFIWDSTSVGSCRPDLLNMTPYGSSLRKRGTVTSERIR